MTDLLTPCDKIHSVRLRQICRGESNLPHWKVNACRQREGLPPLYPEVNVPAIVPRDVVKDQEKLVLEGPGTEFAGIALLLGIKMDDNCGCKAAMLFMNKVYKEEGPEKYRARSNQLITMIKENKSKWGWDKYLVNLVSAGWSFATHPHLWGKINPAEPIDSMFWYSLELYEKKKG